MSLVSIVTPLYNSGAFIEKTIKSVINQCYSEWEMLIVDDCSTDEGPDIVKKYQSFDRRIKLIKNEKNEGPAISRNKAIFMAKGNYIAFLDSDDIWEYNKLKIQISYMKKIGAPFTYTYYSQISEDDQFIKNIDYLPNKVNYESTMKSNKIGCLTAIYNVNYFGKVYMADIQKRQDYTVWLQLLKKVDFAYCVPEILAKYRIRKNSVSSNKFKLVRYHWEIYRNIENQSFIKSCYYLSYYILSRFLNH